MKANGPKEATAPESLLTVAVLSLDIAHGDVDENLRRVGVMMDSLPRQTDIVVLPELFTTSFMEDTDRMLSLAEPPEGKTMRFISAMAAGKGVMMAGSFLCKDTAPDGQTRYFNRGFMALPDGARVFYDKHHLFCLSKEARLLRPGGQRPPLVFFRGWNVTMLICYELRFPVWGRNVDMRADMLLIPANWPCSRGYAWRQLLIARAIENQVVVAGADRSGRDDYGDYDGLSVVVDELGRQVVPAPASPPAGCPPREDYGEVSDTPYGPVLCATFSLDKVKRLRQWLPTVRDADSFRFD